MDTLLTIILHEEPHTQRGRVRGSSPGQREACSQSLVVPVAPREAGAADILCVR